MFERFFPDTTVSSTYAIDYEKLYKEGYKREDIILKLMGGINYTEDMLDEIKIQHLSKEIQK